MQRAWEENSQVMDMRCMFLACECMFLNACVACFRHVNACFWMHALRVFDMRMHVFDMWMHDFDMRMHVFGCTRCVFSTCECMFSMYPLDVFDMRMHVFEASTCQNMPSNGQNPVLVNTLKTWNRDLYPKTRFLEVRKVRMAGAKMDLSTLVFSPKHMFTYRHFAFDGRTALGP